MGNFRKNMEHKSQLIFEIEPEDAAQTTQAFIFSDCDTDTDKALKVRLDKWLWAARFFKTRALARSAVEQGNVYYDGQKVTPSKEIELGVTLLINQGKHKKVIIIRKLSTRRRNAEGASELFEIVASNLYESETQPIFEGEKRPRKMVRFLRRSIPAIEPAK